MDGSSGPGMDDEPPPEPRDGWLLVRIHVPELNIYKCLQFPSDRLIWDVKQQVLSSLPKELKESFNYGLFCPPSNGKAGKFLDEERRLGEYPFNGPVGYLELKYKRRVYKMLSLDERQLKALHTRANLRRFLECINGGHVEKITKMCAKGLDPNFHCPESGETPLCVATGCKKPNKLLIALVNGGALLDYRTKDGTTALHRAVEKDSLEAVTTLLELGASPNYKDARGLTPLYVSITRKCEPKITETLLHDHANLGIQDTQGWNEVHQACRHGLIHHLEHLLFYGADMDAQNASGNTPLHVCAVNNQEACAKMLLFRGAQRGALNYANQSPYQVAVIAGNLELAEMIQNYKSEEVVPFRGPPRYNPKRRSGINWINGNAQINTGTLMNPITRNSLCVPHGPPSPCPSEHLPYSSASSSLSEGSSGHRSHEDDISFVTDKSLGEGSDIISDSSGVGTNSDSAACSIGHPSTTVVCMENYIGTKPGHIRLQQGDIIEVVGSTDCGLLEGYVRGTNKSGFFPAECVQEVNMRQKSGNILITGTGVRNPSSLSTYQHSSTGSSVLQGSPQLSIGGSSGIGGSNSGTLPRTQHQPSPSLSISNKGSNITLNGNAAIIGSPADDQMNKENNINHYCTATAPRIKKPTFNEPKTVVLHRAKRGFGFILRGAKASSQLMQLKPSERFPALQYLDDVDPGGVADMAGLKPGDFLLAINGTDVRSASHEKVVEMIRSAGTLVSMTVISPQFPNQMQGTPQLMNTHHVSSGPSTPQANHRQCATLPRKMSMGPGASGRMPAPAPPRRDPKTTLSVGRARAKSMVAGLENGGEKDENGVKQTKSSSVESIVAPTPTNPGTPVQLRTASIKARPTSNRITAAELEELFQRQQGESVDGGSKFATMMTTSNFQTGTESGCATPPANNTSPIKGPLVYGSVAEMKRKTKSKNGTLRGKPVSVPVIGGSEMKRFHSTPDLMGHTNGSSSSIWNAVGKSHHSQDDVATLHASMQRLNTLPPPSHPPPPPPVGQVVKVETRSNASEYESTVSLQQKLKKRAENDAVTSAAIDGIQSSFNPSANAKIYASPQELRNVMAWKMRQSQDIRQNTQHPKQNQNNHVQMQNSVPTPIDNSQINPYAQPTTTKPIITEQSEKSHYASTQRTCQVNNTNGTINNNINSTNNNQINNTVITSAPPIPDPDYSLSESDGEDENSILVARNTKLNEKIAFIEVPETSGNSQTSGSSTSSTTISHSLSVEEIQRVRNNLKTSKSSPNGFHKPKETKNEENVDENIDETSKPNDIEERDNGSLGCTSEQEKSPIVPGPTAGIMKPTDTIKKKPSVTIVEDSKSVTDSKLPADNVINTTAVNLSTTADKKEPILKQNSNDILNASTPEGNIKQANLLENTANKGVANSNTVTVKQLVQQQHVPVIQQQQQQMSGTKVKAMVITSQQLPNKVQPNMAKRITSTQASNPTNAVAGNVVPECHGAQKVSKVQQQPQQISSHQQQLQQVLKAKNLASGASAATILTKQQQLLKGSGQNLQTAKNEGSIDMDQEQRSEDDGELSPSPPAKAFQRHNSLTRKQAAAIAMQRASKQSPNVLLTQLPPPLEADSESEISFGNNAMGTPYSKPSCIQQVCPENIVLAPPPQFCDCNDIKHSTQVQQQPNHPHNPHNPQQQYSQQRQPQILIIQQHPQQQQMPHAVQQQPSHLRNSAQQHILMNMSGGNATGTLGRVRIVSSIPKASHHHGCHIEVRTRQEHAADYYNYKGWYSVVLFALVDAKYRFTYINVGNAGRCNDSSIFENSALKRELEKYSLLRDLRIRYDDTEIPALILGDSAFRLTKEVMKPYPFHTENSPLQRSFNYRLSKCRRVVENTFGHLKARFRRLGKDIDTRVGNAKSVICAACILHNFLITEKDVVQDSWIKTEFSRHLSTLTVAEMKEKK